MLARGAVVYLRHGTDICPDPMPGAFQSATLHGLAPVLVEVEVEVEVVLVLVLVAERLVNATVRGQNAIFPNTRESEPDNQSAPGMHTYISPSGH